MHLTSVFLFYFPSRFSDGEPIKLPDNLESLPRADSFPSQRHRWNTNEVSFSSKLVFLCCFCFGFCLFFPKTVCICVSICIWLHIKLSKRGSQVKGERKSTTSVGPWTADRRMSLPVLRQDTLTAFDDGSSLPPFPWGATHSFEFLYMQINEMVDSPLGPGVPRRFYRATNYNANTSKTRTMRSVFGDPLLKTWPRVAEKFASPFSPTTFFSGDSVRFAIKVFARGKWEKNGGNSLQWAWLVVLLVN